MVRSESASRPLIIGRIVGVYGVKGWVRIHSFTEPEENLLRYNNCSLGREANWKPVNFDAGKYHGKGLIAHIEGLDDRTEAETLKGSEIVIPVEELPVLEEGEFYWRELEGLEVYAQGRLLGSVAHLLETGANDVLVVRPSEGSIDQRERLIPWLRDCVVRSVDLNAKRIEVDWDLEF